MSDGMDVGVQASRRLAALGAVTFDPGLTDDEFASLERDFGLSFADDQRAFLSAGLPVGAGWPDWRGRRGLQKQLQLPAAGIVFAVEWREFWVDAWGARPAKPKDAVRSANYHLARAPQLVPVYSHWYLPAAGAGHPVLSVVRTDVTVAGADLADYIEREFGSSPTAVATGTPTVAFWSQLALG